MFNELFDSYESVNLFGYNKEAYLYELDRVSSMSEAERLACEEVLKW